MHIIRYKLFFIFLKYHILYALKLLYIIIRKSEEKTE
jgi:hypothetical protein